MTVNELIQVLQTMPPGAQVIIVDGEKGQCGDTRTVQPEQEWNSHTENYVVTL